MWISSLSSLQTVVLKPTSEFESYSAVLNFCLKQNFKTELDLKEIDDTSLVTDLENLDKTLITKILLNTVTIEFDSFINLRQLVLDIFPGQSIPDKLCDSQIMPKLIVKLFGFDFSSKTMASFEKFMRVREHRVVDLNI